MPAYLPILPGATSVYFDKGFDGNLEEVQRREQALEAMARRNLPTPYDPSKVVSVLKDLVDDPREDGHAAGMLDRDKRALVSALVDGIARSAANNPVGISEDQAGAYALGPGDAQTHQALRDSNLLNAALGYPNVPNVQALRSGQVLGSGRPMWEGTPAENLDVSANYWHKGEANPNHWASIAESYYPQNAWIGQQGALANVTENNGGSAWGNALAFMGRWDNGGNRAIREPSQMSGPAVDAAKLVSGWGQGADDERTHQRVKGYVNRPSPLLPKGIAPGSPEANAHIQDLTAIRDATVLPKSQDYAASQGRELSRLGKAWADNKLAPFDPATALTGGVGIGRAVLGKTALAAARAAGAVAKAEAISEGISPFNYAGALGSLLDDPKSSMTPEQYRANSDKSRQALVEAEDVLRRYGR